MVNGDIPVEKIYEDAKTFVILDIDPLSDGHVLVVSKKQIDSVWDLSDEDYLALWKTAKKIANKMDDVFGGVRIGSIVEGWQVPHAHVHLVPLYDNDVLRLHHGYPVDNSSENRKQLIEALKID